MIKIAPSILTADFSYLKKDLSWFDKTGVEILHLDIMDGHFVPNISFGSCVLKSIRNLTSAIFDVHLMVTNPAEFIDSFASSGADWLTVHLEVIEQEKHKIKPEALLNKIRQSNKNVGLSLNPKTPTASIYPYIPLIDLVLVMSVEPGLGGQKFIIATLRKIEMLRRYIDSNNFKCVISVDGGINETNIKTVANAGADILVCGNSIFGKKNPRLAFKNLMKTLHT
ncbi:MAG: ribulose-phosphate 3-epimerase [Elusimicrobiota bacterium]|nr:ribulose-phosphate 3-epimerase [Elusimicrobiota bacterium]